MELMKWRDRQVPDSWNSVRSLQDQINALFNDDLFPASTGLFDRSFSPSVDVVETADNYLVSCELPGLSEKEIDVQVSESVLTIKGEKKTETEDKDQQWFRKESWHGSFQRTIPLPTGVDNTKIKGEMEHGVLRLTLPKREEVKPRQISVKVK